MTQPAADRTATAQPEDFFQLLKPRVMSLVVFTALTGLVAAPGAPDPFLAAIAVLCIALGAGAAGALNMAIEGETDALMRRTRGRPVAAGRVSRNDAVVYGVILSFVAVTLLAFAANLLAAGLLALTIVYYVGLYTVVLKRRTPQNIVIGGAAGAFPPVIGWAAATGDAPWQAWLLFLIIFLWTPPHSWALALYNAGDYAKAGIPMMPVARGAAATRRQVMAYSVPMALAGVAPALVGLGGGAYLAVSTIGGAMFLFLAFRLLRSRAGETPDKAEAEGREAAIYDVRAEAKVARNLFAYSILYLFALFATLLVEHSLNGAG
ncbi:heme o synthase [Brevundimonas sp. 2R-24]|uniref:Protoheme IX farnesyltransferase n=1 Tax=Peiella sedimenti TaxID=3061083 RepID=A0ABT8SHL8_9CAUL|nr:heme o synthase [Caulobacteraceae bacterium XZ-24]